MYDAHYDRQKLTLDYLLLLATATTYNLIKDKQQNIIYHVKNVYIFYYKTNNKVTKFKKKTNHHHLKERSGKKATTNEWMDERSVMAFMQFKIGMVSLTKRRKNTIKINQENQKRRQVNRLNEKEADRQTKN